MNSAYSITPKSKVSIDYLHFLTAIYLSICIWVEPPNVQRYGQMYYFCLFLDMAGILIHAPSQKYHICV